jgi:hypothetical protein
MKRTSMNMKTSQAVRTLPLLPLAVKQRRHSNRVKKMQRASRRRRGQTLQMMTPPMSPPSLMTRVQSSWGPSLVVPSLMDFL